MSKGGTRKGAGRPKGEPTETKSFRFKKKVLRQAVKMYGRKLNRMANTWLNSIVETPPAKPIIKKLDK